MTILSFTHEATAKELSENPRLHSKVVRFSRNTAKSARRYQFNKVMPKTGNIKFVELANYDAKLWWPIGRFQSVHPDTHCWIDGVEPWDIAEEKETTDAN
jgi:hypothetical protein